MSRQNFLQRHRYLITGILAVTWLAALTATHVPQESVPNMGMSDKNLHLYGFLGLGGIFWITLAAYGIRRNSRVLMVICIVTIYAALDESTQGWVNRNPDVVDWTFDVLGTIVAVTVLEIFWRLAFGPQPPPPVLAKDPYEKHPF
jgi:VanZ family protein